MTQNDSHHLDLMVTLHYVLAGVQSFFAMTQFINIALGVLLVLNADSLQPTPEGPAPHPLIFFPSEFGWLFIILGSIAVVFCLAMTFATFLSARSIKHRRNLFLCKVFAGVECLMFPFGTALGVFTLIMLSKPAVQRLFEVETAPEPATV
ncbi:MAG: hypothetical protein CL927_09705 [Deltaproteobacteria bacterium]|nr:hypothetical protein [Deltaproteobacteria bacterium]HCH63123.1 hypothetical protein [Deltaproteobacteria bacterium]|tara:strand:+ start:100 stop:549 length:450 start_codon:yes stop_codon:yes gene_type:complete